MQGGLPIEQDVVTVLQVPLNFVADFQVNIGSVAKQREVDLSFIVPYDVLRTRPLIWTIFYQSPKHFDVLRGDGLWYGKTCGNCNRYAELVKGQIRIWRDHSTG